MEGGCMVSHHSPQWHRCFPEEIDRKGETEEPGLSLKMDQREAMLAGSLLLSFIIQVWCQLCGGPCHNCPWPAARCPPGVPVVLDGCHCCQMCARQEGESCSERLVCDSRLGLRCDYSASYPGGPGECVSQNSLGCDLDGVRFEEGQTFQPSCAQLCHCLGGGVTCVPLCSDDLRVPDAATCANAQLVRPPGRCCREWACDAQDNSVYLDAVMADNPLERPPEREAGRPDLSGGDVAVSPGQGPASHCIKQSTDWSPCSRSCGPGVSTRSSNQNWACRPQSQTRLCQVRSCRATAVPQSMSQVGTGACESSYESSVPIRLQHRGCLSLRAYRPRFCGPRCPDGRCCRPHRTRTIRLVFSCPPGRTLHLQVMVIESCSCHRHFCPHAQLSAYGRATPWL
ncbi:CCN family member 5 [Esox lucius]|uniref:Cellular communication network factor 5 n=1 Tax=Esox lucius TaxID=8010 RepID=A0A3P8YAA6_ESOLU|nr:CCN family member 5 [Esox lucius]XP_019910839.2 CCN family member 5 [Esox lucius]